MDFIGFIAGLMLVFFPPVIVREQISRAGEDARAWLADQLPWHLKRIKSYVVGRSLLLAVAMAVATGAWLYTLYSYEPQLFNEPVIFFAALAATGGQLLFALWNYVNGRLRFRDLPDTTPTERAYAARSLARAAALRETAEQANQRFEAARSARDPLLPPTAELVTASNVASQVNLQVAEAYSLAAAAQAVVHRVDTAFSCASAAKRAMDIMSRIVAVIPGDPALEANYIASAGFANNAEQAAEVAMSEEDNRVWVLGIATRFSYPQWWAVFTIVSLLVLGVYTHVYAIGVEDRLLVALSYVPFFMVFIMSRVTAEVFSWLVLKGTKLGEFILTKASQLAVAVLPGDTLESVRGAIDINVFEEEKIAAAVKNWVNLAGIMWLPYGIIVFWLCTFWVSVAMLATTLVASIFSVAYLSRGKKEEVDESTTKTVGWFWKYGKYITFVVIFLGGSSVEWDGLMNRVAGVTPILILSGSWKSYLLYAVIFTILCWILWKVMKALDISWLDYVLKPAAVICGAVALICVLAPISRAAKGGDPVITMPQRSGPQAEPPVDITSPVATFLPQPNGREKMVISFTTRARQAKGVVRFEPQVASQLGLDAQDIPVKTYSGLVDCGSHRCRRHEVVIPEIKSRPHGNFQVIMRNWLSVESSPEFGI